MVKNKFAPFLILLLLCVSPSHAAWTDYIPLYGTFTGAVDTATGLVDSFSGMMDSITDAMDSISSFFNPDDTTIIETGDIENQTALGIEDGEYFSADEVNSVGMASLDNISKTINSEYTCLLNTSVTGTGLGKIDIGLRARDKLYGYSAFSVAMSIYKPETYAYQDNFHLTSYSLWVEDIENPGVKLWTYSASSSEVATPGGSAITDATILKAPDDKYSVVKSCLTSNSNLMELDGIITSQNKQFEIHGNVVGYIENWQEVAVTTSNPDGSTTTTWKWVRKDNIPVDLDIVTTSMWQHENNGAYSLDGATGTLPVSDWYEYGGLWVTYASLNQGSTSNLLAQFWSSPVHILDSSSSYKFFALYNAEYNAVTDLDMDLSNVDTRIVTLAVSNDSNFEVAGSDEFSNLNIDSTYAISGNLPFMSSSDNVASWKVYAITYGEITRDDGQKLPVWTVVRPWIAVNDNVQILNLDTAIELEDLYLSGDINSSALEEVKTTAISEIETMLDSIEQDLGYAERNDNTEMINALNKAKTCLNNAKSVIESLSSTDTEDEKTAKINKYKLYLEAAEMYLKASACYKTGLDSDGEYYEDMADELVSKESIVITSDGIFDVLNDIPILGTLVSYIPGGWWTVLICGVLAGGYVYLENDKKKGFGRKRKRF
ncbi:hypothetical protein [Methanococcus maripaludis]|uniref:Uncharacterized protein n=1 Tax=Methanococcus maripaludis OS7 TaxID=637915 RepID=A0A2Z5PNT1_METMI|nr:hypothetical protein [Methanococcus maripaludis]BAP62134.1 hypothetical protein MMOS7_00480 [Methanococcus maripaludis OS7]